MSRVVQPVDGTAVGVAVAVGAIVGDGSGGKVGGKVGSAVAVAVAAALDVGTGADTHTRFPPIRTQQPNANPARITASNKRCFMLRILALA